METNKSFEELVSSARGLVGTPITFEQASALRDLQHMSETVNTFLRLRAAIIQSAKYRVALEQIREHREGGLLPSEEEAVNGIDSFIVNLISGKLTRAEAAVKLQWLRDDRLGSEGPIKETA
jgi:hypothetical protein